MHYMHYMRWFGASDKRRRVPVKSWRRLPVHISHPLHLTNSQSLALLHQDLQMPPGLGEGDGHGDGEGDTTGDGDGDVTGDGDGNGDGDGVGLRRLRFGASFILLRSRRLVALIQSIGLCSANDVGP